MVAGNWNDAHQRSCDVWMGYEPHMTDEPHWPGVGVTSVLIVDWIAWQVTSRSVAICFFNLFARHLPNMLNMLRRDLALRKHDDKSSQGILYVSGSWNLIHIMYSDFRSHDPIIMGSCYFPLSKSTPTGYTPCFVQYLLPASSPSYQPMHCSNPTMDRFVLRAEFEQVEARLLQAEKAWESCRN